ncbi:hypothetical protein HDU82_007426, partial [Entophlyctis luteolus]
IVSVERLDGSHALHKSEVFKMKILGFLMPQGLVGMKNHIARTLSCEKEEFLRLLLECDERTSTLNLDSNSTFEEGQGKIPLRLSGSTVKTLEYLEGAWRQL